MPSLRFFGSPSLDLTGELQALPLNTPTSLLFYLAVKGDWVSRSELAFLYKPDETETEALRYLRLQIHRAQQYPWASKLEVEQHQLRWLIPNDVSCFREAIQKQQWQLAIEIYKAPFFSQHSFRDLVTYNAWLDLEREQFEKTYRIALNKQIEILEQQQAFEAVLELSSRRVALNEFNEEAMQNHLRYLALAGQKSDAILAYERFAKLLQDEFESKPTTQTQELIKRIISNAVLKPIRDQSLNHNLPNQSTHFVGRNQELVQLQTLLTQPDCRLLSLVGLGGSGKTRLALELAKTQLDKFSNGVYFVALTSLNQRDQFSSAIAHALSLPLEAKPEPKEQLLRYLQNKHLLLILDNFEHLFIAAPDVNELLEAAKNLKIVVTSRENLKLQSEWLFQVQGLNYPEIDSKDHLADYEAISLFIRASKRVAPQLTFMQPELECIGNIARKVEGLPLALELAASLTRIMSVQQLKQELDRSFNLLESALVDVPMRHKSIQTVLDSSWHQLNPPLQASLVQLGVFSGGFTLEAAATITGLNSVILLSLVNLSLVKRSQSGRYDLHEIIRQYLEFKLSHDAKESLQRKHLAYFVQWSQKIETQPLNSEFSPGVTTLDEYGNLLKALRWGLNHALVDTLPLLKALAHFWETYGLYTEADHWLSEAMRLQQDWSLEDKADLTTRFASIVRGKGEMQRAEKLTREALEFSQQAGTPSLIAQNLMQMGRIFAMQGLYQKSNDIFKEALEVCKLTSNHSLHVDILDNLGMVAGYRGDFETNAQLRAQALKLAQTLQDQRRIAKQLNNSGYSLFLLKRFTESEILWHEALKLCKSISYISLEANLLVNLGNAAEVQFNYPKALLLMKEGLMICLESAYQFDFFNQSTDLVRLWVKLKAYKDATYLLGAAHALQKMYHYQYSESQKPDQLIDELQKVLTPEIFDQFFFKGQIANISELRCLLRH